MDYQGYPSSNASIVLIQSRQSLQVASVIAIVANISVCPSGPLSRHVGHSDSGTPARHESQGPASVASLTQFRTILRCTFISRSEPTPARGSVHRAVAPVAARQGESGLRKFTARAEANAGWLILAAHIGQNRLGRADKIRDYIEW